MKISAQIGEREFEVIVQRVDGHFEVTIDGETRLIDAHKLEDDLYSIVTEGKSYEVSVEAAKDGYFVGA